MQLLPTVTAGTALFLDFDGTLAELAPTPDSVHVPSGLVTTIAALRQQLGGALAIVTGRRVEDVDRFLSPLLLPVAGEHGAEFRLPDGTSPTIAPPPLGPALDVMERLAATHHGLLVERKPHSVALHYRHAPDLEGLCLAAVQGAVAQLDGVELLRGKCVFEVKSAHVDKGRAIAIFMQAMPFEGRMPIFVGDDVTDEAGFAAVQSLGGVGIKVGEGPTQARYRCQNPAALRGWLSSARSGLAAAEASMPPQSPSPSAES